MKQETIKNSEAKRQQQINEAEGQGQAILTIANATAEGIRRIAEAIQSPGGHDAVNLRVAEQYIAQLGNIAKTTNTVVLPANLADAGSLVATAMTVLNQMRDAGTPPPPPPRAMR